ncbi:hypothetical protein C7M61_003690 [Candidozyma pseudohaemuli]|uniref:Membrane protein PTM1 n=1 Tax=Candidozyma pseudohaemuli TaxID=418784 RepID=A0A2P7YLJ1_9ASCO|nr:hypothetical protein C7M61_003690 [[Candida] pseudohaemulonii]PSK36826.1 hypothetical protein C7M61_003690 [[Candida] pseudohaemulonii]
MLPKLTGAIVGLLTLSAVTVANRVPFDENDNAQVCEGMYSKKDWGGSIHPQIQLKLEKFGSHKYDKKNPEANQGGDTRVSYVVFEYKDIVHLGKTNKAGRRKYICDTSAIAEGLCEDSSEGKFIVNSDITNTTVQTAQLTHLGPGKINYSVDRTGYYCVATYSDTNSKYKGMVNFQNAFGHLSASEIPKLPAYGILTLMYAVVLALFGFQFFKKRNQNQILPLQRYLLAMLGFLTFDTLVVWSYYDLKNRTANQKNGFVIFYTVFLSFLNAGKMTFFFFLLLCIGLGYGVVKLKLPKKIMFRCKLLAGFHFAASMFYLVMTYVRSSQNSLSSNNSVSSDNYGASIWDIIPMIPVAVTMTAFYVSILTSIRGTTANLHKQRQVIKLQLYENLFRIIFLSVFLSMGGLVLSSFIILSLSTTDVIEEHWKGSYFLFDFWPSIVFFLVFLGVSWLWRPTETSYMLAASQQLATDGGEEGEHTGAQGHEFELDDISLMSHDDDENNLGRDSFELQNLNIPSEAPPNYEEDDAVHKRDLLHGEAGKSSNTLFELGDDDDDRQHGSSTGREEYEPLDDDDESDDRLKK